MQLAIDGASLTMVLSLDNAIALRKQMVTSEICSPISNATFNKIKNKSNQAQNVIWENAWTQISGINASGCEDLQTCYFSDYSEFLDKIKKKGKKIKSQARRVLKKGCDLGTNDLSLEAKKQFMNFRKLQKTLVKNTELYPVPVLLCDQVE